MKTILSVWLPIALASAALAADETGGGGLAPQHQGYGLYQQLCSECHGVRADGNGPRAAEFHPRPPDLTHLRGSDGAPLSRDDLALIIDGRRTLRAHGDGGMPVWGWELVPDVPDAETRERARHKMVYDLADYILTIQRPEPSQRGDEEPSRTAE